MKILAGGIVVVVLLVLGLALVRSPSPAVAPPAEPPVDPRQARAAYVNCQACHGIDGQGVSRMGPPLAASALVEGTDSEALIRLVLRGLPKREPWMIGMPGFARLEDAEIAEALTHVRSRWGHQAPPVTAAQVARIRLTTPLLDHP